MKIVLALFLAGFVVFCGVLIAESGLFGNSHAVGKSCILLQQTTANNPEPANASAAREAPQMHADEFAAKFSATGGPVTSVTVGSIDQKSGFKLQLELSSKGAAIRKAAFSEFDDRDYKDPQPLVLLSPVSFANGSEILSMANREFVFVEQKLQLRLDKLHWKSYGVERDYDGSQTARFEAIIKDTGDKPVIKLVKAYKVMPGSYLLDCYLAVENLSACEQKVRFNLAGPLGLGREDVGYDMRKVVAGFRDSQGQVTGVRLDTKKLRKARGLDDRRLTKPKPGANFLWVAVVNKYFAAILVPATVEGKDFCEWVADKTGRFYNPDGDQRGDTGDETVGVDLEIASSTLAAASQANSIRRYDLMLYLGPKDKSLFDKSQLYRNLGFVQTIDFLACCCPASIIHPLAFGVLALMKWMYSFVHNYGVVIIILVFLMRLAMHPVTKKSQVSMSKMSGLAPKVEQIRKKYAGNKTEMNKRVMALYKEQGASPIMGMLPMIVQMPIWIALYSAINASVELRGAPFLPFWITDLSAPDALIRFSTVTVPLLGWKIASLNLLPILMGVAFYLQQKLMPHQQAASTSPQMAQQQKMMMIMFPLLFPLMLYNRSSGLNLYIMSSVFAGVIEQYVIRKHIRERGEAESQGLVAATSKTGAKRKRKKPKPFYKL